LRFKESEQTVGGPSGSDKKSERTDASGQQGIGSQFSTMAQNELTRMNQLEAPATSFYGNLVKAGNSGDYSKLIAANAPQFTAISQQGQAAKENIYNTLPPGAARDYALGSLDTSKANSVASNLNSTYMSAFPALAQLGSQAGNTGLQEAGASLRGFEGAATTTNNVMSQDAASKASTMGFLGSLAGAAGSAAGGGAFGKLGCWVAEAIYGVTDPRTHLVRAWLNGPFRETREGAAVMWLYLKIGRQVAWLVRRSEPLRRALKPLFDLALARAVAEKK
jgi:hypothetical protein